MYLPLVPPSCHELEEGSSNRHSFKQGHGNSARGQWLSTGGLQTRSSRSSSSTRDLGNANPQPTPRTHESGPLHLSEQAVQVTDAYSNCGSIGLGDSGGRTLGSSACSENDPQDQCQDQCHTSDLASIVGSLFVQSPGSLSNRIVESLSSTAQHLP